MDKVFLQIFNTAITGGWLVLAVLVARLLLKKAPAWAKCALWAIVALRLIWPFEIESILSLLPSTQTIPEAELYAAAPQLHTGVHFVNSTINPVFSEVFASEPANSVNPLQIAVILGGWVWVLGMIVMAAYSLISYWRLRRKVSPAVRQEGNVYLCDGISSPFILGIFRPRIYLPSELSPEKWDSILAHERAHLSRRDHWWKPLGFLLLTVFWFHPLLWLGYVLLCRDVELACDEKVIASLSPEEKRSYSQILLECSVPQKWITACPLAFGETGVKQRIKAVLHYKKPTLWILIAAIIACTVLAVCFLTDPVENQEDNTEVYMIGDRVAGIITTGYWVDHSGYVRITDGNILEIALKEPHSTSTDTNLNWKSLGEMSEFTLTEENFDKYLIDSIATVIRQDNEKVWRVPAENGSYHYFLQQKDGNCYILLYESWLYILRDSTWRNIAGNRFVCMQDDHKFTIHFSENGSFRYYEGECVESIGAAMGSGNWEQKYGKLYLYTESWIETRTFVFDIQKDSLVFLGDESRSFVFATGEYDATYIQDVAVFYAVKSASTGVAGKRYLYEKAKFGWEFTISLYEDGTYQYYEGTLSSYIGIGTWTQEGDIVCLHETRSTLGGEKELSYYFRVSGGELIFLADRSDRFAYLNVTNGDRFFATSEIEEPTAQTALMWTKVEKYADDYLIVSDVMGTYYKVLWSGAADCEGFLKDYCWVSYYGVPIEGTDFIDGVGLVEYYVVAERCWQSAGTLETITGTVFDCIRFDIDGDGVMEDCVLSYDYKGLSPDEIPPSFIASAGGMGGYRCKLSVWDGDVCEYEASFEGSFVTNSDYISQAPPSHVDLSQGWPVLHAFAFVYNNGQLQIVTPYDINYVYTGVLKTFDVVFDDGKLTVTDA